MWPLDWTLPFKVICDTSDYTVGVIQKKDNKPYAIYYASQTLDEVHINYAITEKELLVVVFVITSTDKPKDILVFF